MWWSAISSFCWIIIKSSEHTKRFVWTKTCYITLLLCSKFGHRFLPGILLHDNRLFQACCYWQESKKCALTLRRDRALPSWRVSRCSPYRRGRGGDVSSDSIWFPGTSMDRSLCLWEVPGSGPECGRQSWPLTYTHYKICRRNKRRKITVRTLLESHLGLPVVKTHLFPKILMIIKYWIVVIYLLWYFTTQNINLPHHRGIYEYRNLAA